MSCSVSGGGEIFEEIRVIEMSMMEPKKYYPLTMVSGLVIRSILYPLTLIKTRLQIQVGKDVYKGTIDAMIKIPKNEGISGLYRGFLFNSFQMIPSIVYITTYENIRDYMVNTRFSENWIRSFVGGGAASVIGQTLAVPIDIVTQHVMLLGNKKSSSRNSKGTSQAASQKLRSLREIHIPEEVRNKRFGTVNAVCSHVYQHHGVRGFYKGYFVSIAVYAPNSALWWLFYDTYTDTLMGLAPDWLPRLPIQCVSAPMAGVSAAVFTNPLDVIRARMQVKGGTFKDTYQTLWKEESYRFVLKGLSARLFQSTLHSFFIMLGYESIKRMSLLDEYKEAVRW